MNPFIRYLVVGAVGFIVAAGFVVLGLLNSNSPTFQVLSMIAGALLAAAVSMYLFVQAWRWSVWAYREGHTGRSLGIALAGGFVIMVGAAAMALAAILALLFFG